MSDDERICPHRLINSVMEERAAEMLERTGERVPADAYIIALTQCLGEWIAGCADPERRAWLLRRVISPNPSEGRSLMPPRSTDA